MTLEESVRRFLDILGKRREIMNIIEQNHIHTQNDRLVFNRYKNADNEYFREHIRKGIEKGKDWHSALDGFPLPDKPFDIEDVEDVKAKEYFRQILELDEEEIRLGVYIRQNYGDGNSYQRAMAIFNEKYGVE